MTQISLRDRGNNLDLLRLFFASLVLLSHAPELLDGNRSRELLSVLTGNVLSFGEFAVSGFFALSGYLIMASWSRRPELLTFFKHRILRIYPAYIVDFSISVLIVGAIGANTWVDYYHQFGIKQLILSVCTLGGASYATSFPSLPYHSVNGAIWTLSYEFACYIAVGIIGVITKNYLKIVWTVLTIALVIGTCFLEDIPRATLFNRFSADVLLKLSSIFFFGGLVYLFQINFLITRKLTWIALFFFTVSLFSPEFQAPGFAFFGTIVILVAGTRIRRFKVLDKMPDISYGTYLYGWPVMQLLIWSGVSRQPVSLFVLTLLVALTFGYLSSRFVEAPLVHLKNNPTRTGHTLELSSITSHGNESELPQKSR